MNKKEIKSFLKKKKDNYFFSIFGEIVIVGGFLNNYIGRCIKKEKDNFVKQIVIEKELNGDLDIINLVNKILLLSLKRKEFESYKKELDSNVESLKKRYSSYRFETNKFIKTGQDFDENFRKDDLIYDELESKIISLEDVQIKNNGINFYMNGEVFIGKSLNFLEKHLKKYSKYLFYLDIILNDNLIKKEIKEFLRNSLDDYYLDSLQEKIIIKYRKDTLIFSFKLEKKIIITLDKNTYYVKHIKV